jgi:hypothetical protein
MVPWDQIRPGRCGNFPKPRIGGCFMSTQHEQIRVEVNGWHAEVDKGLAPLIKELWKANIDTSNSCEDNRPGHADNGTVTDPRKVERWPDGCVWIQMPASCAHIFVEIIVDFEGDRELYYRIIDPDPENNKAWEFDTELVDYTRLNPESDGPVNLEFAISVRFPKEDLEKVYGKVRAYNEKQAHNNKLIYQFEDAIRSFD